VGTLIYQSINGFPKVLFHVLQLVSRNHKTGRLKKVHKKACQPEQLPKQKQSFAVEKNESLEFTLQSGNEKLSLISPLPLMAGLQCHAIKNKNRNNSIN